MCPDLEAHVVCVIVQLSPREFAGLADATLPRRSTFSVLYGSCLEYYHPVLRVSHLGEGWFAGLVDHALGPTQHGQVVPRVQEAVVSQQLLRAPPHAALPVLLALGP